MKEKLPDWRTGYVNSWNFATTRILSIWCVVQFPSMTRLIWMKLKMIRSPAMTREEAIAVLAESKRQNEVMRDNPSTFWASYQMADGVKNAERRIAALNMALTALRPVSRERVEKVWKSEWTDSGKRDLNGVPKPFAISCKRCGSSAGVSWMKFCPNCGAPMTDEAVQMVMERLEALYE